MPQGQFTAADIDPIGKFRPSDIDYATLPDKANTHNNTVSAWTRKSPIGGYEEVIIPDSQMIPGHAAETGQTFSSPSYPTTTYSASNANDPEITSHERIHQGQRSLDIPLTPKQVQNSINKKNILSSGYGDPSRESPAYLFSQNHPLFYQATDDEVERQQLFNNYIDKLKDLNPDSYVKVFAAADPKLQQGYISHGGHLNPVSPDLIRKIIKEK